MLTNASVLEKSYPFPWKWELHGGIVPLKEDYFDYQPLEAALLPHLYGLTQFMTLTRENVASFQFQDLKVYKTDKTPLQHLLIVP